MENVSEIIGIVLIIIGAFSLAQAALSGNLTLGGILIPILFIVVGAWFMRSLILVHF